MSSMVSVDSQKAVPKSDWRSRLLGTTELSLSLLIVLCVAIFASINPVFLSVQIFETVLRSVTFVGIIAIGMTFLLISGKFDLSVGAVAALAAIVAGQLMHLGSSTWVACLVGLLAAALVGLTNALLTLWLRIPVLIVTLGTLYIARGFALVISDGQAVVGLTDGFIWFGQATFLNLPYSSWIFLGLSVVAYFVLKLTPYGRFLYASGGNEEAARLAGVPVRAVQTVSFVLVSTLSGLVGLLIMARIESGQPTIGQFYELGVLAACVVGGVSLFGGKGSISGMWLGVFFVQVISIGLVTSQVSPTFQEVGVGTALLVAVVLDVLRSQPGSGGKKE